MTVTGTSGIAGFNERGELAFRASFEHPTNGFKSGLVLADPQGTPRVVAATGDDFDVHGDGSVFREILRIQPGGLSETGTVAFRLDFTDGSSGHFAATASAPGVTAGLRVAKAGGDLELTWDPGCGGSQSYGIYRGDLAQGLASLTAEPDRCAVAGTTAMLAMGPGNADFFLVVPNTGATEGSAGTGSGGEPRPQALLACFPRTTVAACGQP